MALVDRRIGLVFLAFLALLSFGLLRAAYLGAFRAGSLQQVAATQQVTKLVIPPARGAITDRRGIELAVTESADGT